MGIGISTRRHADDDAILEQDFCALLLQDVLVSSALENPILQEIRVAPKAACQLTAGLKGFHCAGCNRRWEAKCVLISNYHQRFMHVLSMLLAGGGTCADIEANPAGTFWTANTLQTARSAPTSVLDISLGRVKSLHLWTAKDHDTLQLQI
jgi:hypothetical protein